MSMASRIESRLREALDPLHLDLENESYKHAVPRGSETHWKLVVVSPAFAGKRLVQRHRAVYEALGQELRDGIHALAMKTLTPEEWAAEGGGFSTPPCHGGSKADG